MLSAFKEHLIGDSIRVYPPKRYVLLCGGEVSNITAPAPISLRDGFLRGDGAAALKGADVLQIEEIQEYFEKDSPYPDLVDFERDIAQVCELVLLFSEGPGSFAELGSFSSFDEIFEKLLVVIQSKFLTRPSFITKGPVASLKRKFPNSVFTITDEPMGIAGSNLANLDCELLRKTLKGPIETRLKEADSRTTLDVKKYNHLCKSRHPV
jgi:hypothetical protein